MVRINIEVTKDFRKTTKRNALNNNMTLKEYVIDSIKVKNGTMDLITDLEVFSTMYLDDMTKEMHEDIGKIIDKIIKLGGK